MAFNNNNSFFRLQARSKVTKNLDETPLHRSYGVKKRVTVFTRLNNLLATLLAMTFIVLYSVVFVVGIWALTTMLGKIGIALSVLAVLAFVYFYLLRVVRKRIKFIIKLKRKCKALGFKIKFVRGFWKGMRRNTEGIDFTVDTGKKCFCVRYFTTFKFLSHITFIDKETISITKNITKSHFKFILGFNKSKTAEVKYSFDDKFNVYNRKTQKILLLNPVPHDCFKKDGDGAIIPIGTGEHIQDYIIYSASTFINALVRESQE
jgi:hypothetical protein